MADKPIQEQFGEAIINAVRSFARADLEDVPAIEQNYLRHMNDPELRHILAETFYGARWIYKLGLALLVRTMNNWRMFALRLLTTALCAKDCYMI